jgi:hypothetical protein
MSRLKIVIALGFCLIVLCASHEAGAKKYYRYKDRNGRIHIVDSPDKVPARYRDQLEGIELSRGKFDTVPERYYAFDQEFKEVRVVKFKSLILEVAMQTRVIYWLGAEILLLVIFIIAMILSRDFPTRAERRRYAFAFLIAFLVWLIFSVPLGLRPSAISFCKTARARLALIREDDRVPVTYRKDARGLDQKILSVQNIIP